MKDGQEETWLTHLLLGTAVLERGERNASEHHFLRSRLLKPNVHAARNLALLAPDNASQLAFYKEAWAVWLGWSAEDPARQRLGRNLASEFSIWMAVNNEWGTLRAFLVALPAACPGCVDADRVLDAHASLYVHDAAYEKALQLLSSNCFPTYSSDRSRLIHLWYQAHLQMEEARLGRALTRIDTVRLRRKIGCDGDQTVTTWKGQCSRGPPNLGTAY